MFIVCRANPVAVPTGEHGEMNLPREQTITKWFSRKSYAEEYAKHLAGKNPGELYGVMEMASIFEAKKPEIMEKKLNSTGEIVPK